MKWEELDQCKSADEIAEKLRAAGTRGMWGVSTTSCPLAIATKWIVGLKFAHRRGYRCHTLTDPQRSFIERYDMGAYPDLHPDIPQVM